MIEWVLGEDRIPAKNGGISNRQLGLTLFFDKIVNGWFGNHEKTWDLYRRTKEGKLTLVAKLDKTVNIIKNKDDPFFYIEFTDEDFQDQDKIKKEDLEE